MATYSAPRDMEMARRVRRMLIEQSAILQEESSDEFQWLTRHFATEERFLEEELGAHIELRLGRWARVYWSTPPRVRELCIADVFELTTRKQTAYACLIRAFRSVRLLEGHENASTFRFADLYRYVSDEGTRQSPWLSFDETIIANALMSESAADEEDEDVAEDEDITGNTPNRAKSRKLPAATVRIAQNRGANRSSQRARANQRAFYQAVAAFERMRLLRRIGADERQHPDEQFKLDERDYGGIYEFTDLIDRFLPPSGLVQYDEPVSIQ